MVRHGLARWDKAWSGMVRRGMAGDRNHKLTQGRAGLGAVGLG